MCFERNRCVFHVYNVEAPGCSHGDIVSSCADTVVDAIGRLSPSAEGERAQT